MNDTVGLVIVLFGGPLVIIMVCAGVLNRFVGLKAPPARRAAWIVGIGYIVASLYWLFGGPEGDRWEGPLAAIPAALLAFWWWKSMLREAWVDEDRAASEGIKLANTDWKIGLAGVVATAVVIAIKMLVLAAIGH